MSPTEDLTAALKDNFITYLTADIHAPERLAEWCQRSHPAVESCRAFKRQLFNAIQHPGLVSPATYENWTGDDEYSTQEKLQAHFKNIWNMCFPDESLD